MLPASIELIGEPTFRRIWFAGACGNTVRWIEMLAVSIYVFELTGSPFLVALMTVMRALPILFFGTLSGVIADRFDRRVLYASGLAIGTTISGMLFLLAWLDLIEVWHIALGAFLSGVIWSTEHPVRRTMMGEIAGTDRISAAMGLDAATHNATRVLGPLLGGLLFQTLGLHGAYALGIILMVVASALVFAADYQQRRHASATQKILATIIEGLVYVRTQRVILAVLAVTLIVNLFGFPYAAMIAVIGRDVMELSAFAIGLLMAAEATGAFFGSLLVATTARARHYTRLYYFGSLLFLACVLVFSRTSSFEFALVVLVIGGFGVAGFATMQTTLVLSSAAPEMRSRAMGALAVAIGFGPLGMLHLGLMANWLGASTAILVMVVEGVLVLAIAAVIWPELRKQNL